MLSVKCRKVLASLATTKGGLVVLVVALLVTSTDPNSDGFPKGTHDAGLEGCVRPWVSWFYWFPSVDWEANQAELSAFQNRQEKNVYWKFGDRCDIVRCNVQQFVDFVFQASRMFFQKSPSDLSDDIKAFNSIIVTQLL